VPISKYAKMVLLAPAIGSALIGVFGMLLGVALIAHRSHPATRTLATTSQHTAHPVVSTAAASRPAMMAANSAGSAIVPSQPPRLLRISSASRPAVRQAAPAIQQSDALFQKPIPSEQLGFLNDYAGRPANDILRDQKLRELVAAVVPYAPFHLGLDMPLPHALESMLSVSQIPVEVRDGRYVMVTGIRGQGGRGRAFVWVDMQQGVAFGGIFFYPSNGEPTPTLTIFSRQVNQSSLAFNQLPPAFVQDLTRWAAAEGLPPVTTRYFINASSEKIVLAHDEDFCKLPDAGAPASPDNCSKMNADAARIDTEASHFLNRVNYASNATMRTANDKLRIGAPESR
jgi:hypothetical protein